MGRRQNPGTCLRREMGLEMAMMVLKVEAAVSVVEDGGGGGGGEGGFWRWK